MNKILFGVLFCFSINVCFGQHSPARFQHLSISDGLSLSSVYCIYKDSRGFMWFGTEDGLNRFDGYQFKIFRKNKVNSICYKWIEHIEEDARGNLWFGSRGGLSCYNPKQELFTNFSSSSNDQLVNDTISRLQAFKHYMVIGTMNGLSVITADGYNTVSYEETGRVWDLVVNEKYCFVAGETGLYKLDATGTLEPFASCADKPFIDLVLKNNRLYACTPTEVVKLSFQDVMPKDLFTNTVLRSGEEIENCVVDDQSRLWVSTNKGLLVHHIHLGWTKRLVTTHVTTKSLAINTSKAIHHHKDGTIWFATHGDGLFLINSKLQVTRCVHNPTDKESVSQNAFNCIYADLHAGIIWLGTYGAGINVFHDGASKFDLIKHNPLNSNSLPSNFVWTVFESQDSCVWVGTNDKGLCKYCPVTDSYQTFMHRPTDPNSISNNSVRKVFEDSDGTIWVGTDGGGLNQYNSETGYFKAYQRDDLKTNSLSDNSVRVIFEDSHKRMWVGTRQGLNLFDKQSGTFKRFLHNPKDSTSLSNNFIYSSIAEDSFGRIWLGTYGGGLNRLNVETERFKHYTTQGEKGQRLSNDIVFSIYEDKHGLLWIGTNDGLNVLNASTGTIEVYSVADGLPNNVIYAVMPGDDGNIWLSTNNGVSCVDPNTMIFKNYDVSDGLQSNEFNGGAFHKGKSGKLYFGGVYGLNILKTQVLKVNLFVQQPIITGLEVLGSERQTMLGLFAREAEGELLDSQTVINSDITYTDHVTLDYSQRFFAIEYSGLNYLYPNKTQYAFQLSPLNKQWQKAGQRNYVTFSNLKSGHYQFKVISTNTDGRWSDKEATLDITILPPFWLTNWFILLEASLVLLLIVFIYRYLLKIKTGKILGEQYRQIKAANTQLQLSEENLKAINATKDKFFSIISHDLKNPFTSLMSISNLLSENYDQADDEDRKAGVKRINNSVKNIYYLLENLLTWSRSQRGKICFDAKPFDITTLITENINLYREAAQKKQIDLNNKITQSYLGLGDRNTINTIIRNLSGNALKFTNLKGEIIYSIDDIGEFWRVSIKDNGVGIRSEDQQSLFCIDKKIRTDGTSGEKGTGLGLIICKEFADKNGGCIGVSSKLGCGSEFWFTVKKVK